jgi:hypothetical protein
MLQKNHPKLQRPILMLRFNATLKSALNAPIPVKNVPHHAIAAMTAVRNVLRHVIDVKKHALNVPMSAQNALKSARNVWKRAENA